MLTKTRLIALLFTLVLATSGFAYAQDAQGPNFIDEDNDGVCDMQGSGECSGEANQFGNRVQNWVQNRWQDGNGMQFRHSPNDTVPGTAQGRIQQRLHDGSGAGAQNVNRYGLNGEAPGTQMQQRLQDGTGAGAQQMNQNRIGDGQCANFVDEDGDGNCDLMGTSQGPQFTDQDGDGVCDHAAEGGMQSQARAGGQAGRGNGQNQ
jgi:hypothetical protein